MRLLLSRCLLLCVLTVALLTTGMVGPAAGEPAVVIPDTVAEHLDGLPASHDPSVSEAVATPMPFSMVGFSVPEGADLEFRTSADGEDWTTWTEAEVADPDEGPDPRSQEARRAAEQLTEPVWVGKATHLQTRLRGDRGAARPQEVGVELIDSAGLGRTWARRVLDRVKAAWRGTPPAAHAAPGQPPIVRRKQWGADERLRRGSPSYASRIVMGVVHHTAGSNRYSRAEAPAVMRAIYRYHTQSRGWSDIGYNFLIDRYGTIYEGRYGGIDRPVIGAHAGGFNTGSFGASLIGTFDSARPPAAMRAALEQLLAWKYDIHHTDVLGQTSYTSYGSSRYPSGRKVTLNRLSGHRDVSTTACPGGRTYAGLPNLRERVAQLQGPVLLEPAARPAGLHVVNGSSIQGAVRFTTRLRPAGAWTLEVRDPAGALVHSAAGTGTTAASRWTPTAATRGEYTYTFSSADRRSAEGTVSLTAPPISVRAAPSQVRIGTSGELHKPVRFTASLYDNARWNLTVTAPDGGVAHTATGTGSSMSSTWNGPARGGAGTYSWKLTADDVPPASGTLELFYNRVARIGRNADATRAAVQISRRTFGELGARRVVLTRADLPAYAVPAAPLAGGRGPVLYTDGSSLPAVTVNEIRRVLPPGSTVYVLGNGKVIAEAALQELAPLYQVQRVGDASPVRTAAAIADLVLAESGAGTAMVAGISGDRPWRQGVAAAAYGADRGIPILLTRAQRLPRATRNAVARNVLGSVTVLGGTRAVSETVRGQLPDATRLGGAPATTARAVAKRLFGRRSGAAGQAFVFANGRRGDGWARAVAAASLSAREDAPLLLIAKRRVTGRTARYLERLGYDAGRLGSGWLVGNRRHATEPTRDALSRHLQ